VYWDWTLDWEYLELTPILNSDPEAGFGIDGDVNGEITVGKTGRCVIDGVFNTIEASYYDVKKQSHCSSRGFQDDEGNLGIMDGRTLSPESIDKVLSLGEYEGFVKEMESRVHDTIPFDIGGDFETSRLLAIRCSISIIHNLIACGGSGSNRNPKNGKAHTMVIIIDIPLRWRAWMMRSICGAWLPVFKFVL
jgi:hypothetical protein